MSLLFYAQPYDIDANGFFFASADDFEARASRNRNAYGQKVEEYEIQLIEADTIDIALAQAWQINQANIAAYIEATATWDEHGKRSFIIAVGEGSHFFDANSACPLDYDVTIYEERHLKDLAITFVDEGLFGDIPEHLQSYIDYNAIARDLAHDYTELEIAGAQLIYRCE